MASPGRSSRYKCVTRNNYDSPKIGVFSTRSPNRPNPIGLQIAEVIAIENGLVHVSRLEVLDGTSILEIKEKWWKT